MVVVNLESMIVIGFVLLVVALSCMRRNPSMPQPEAFVPFLNKKPTLWWFVDAEPNARNWFDFGARMSDAPNRGYLQLAQESLRKTQGRDFDIVPLIGRDAVLRHLPGADPAAKQLPPALWRSFVIANLLDTHGGLVMDGNSTLCIGPSFYPGIGSVGGPNAATFGINPDEPVASPAAVAPGPAPYVGWAAAPHHPAWSYAAQQWNALVTRGAQAWTAAVARRMDQELWETQKTLGAVVLRDAEGGRLQDGRIRTLEDLLGRSSDTTDPKLSITPGTVYIPYNGDDISRRYEFAWFLRMSVDQIKESNLLWAKLAGYS